MQDQFSLSARCFPACVWQRLRAAPHPRGFILPFFFSNQALIFKLRKQCVQLKDYIPRLPCNEVWSCDYVLGNKTQEKCSMGFPGRLLKGYLTQLGGGPFSPSSPQPSPLEFFFLQAWNLGVLAGAPAAFCTMR